MTFIKIAIRNLTRHKVKTILTTAAVMISVAVFIFVSCWLSGMIIDSRRNIVNYDMAAAKLQTKLYFEKFDERPSYENFKDWERYADALDREGYNAAPRYVFGGMAFAASGSSAPVVVNAVDPEAEARILHYQQYIDFGRFPKSGKFEVALGSIAAEKLRVGIPTRPFKKELDALIEQVAFDNDDDANFIRSLYDEVKVERGFFVMEEKVREGNERMALKRDASRADLDRFWSLVAATDRNNARINAMIDIKDDAGAVRQVNQLIDVIVVGVINSPDPATNAMVYLPLDALQDESGMMLEGAVTELLIRKKGAAPSDLPGRDESAAAITAALEQGLGEPLPDDLGVFFWLEYLKDYLGFEQMENTMPRMIGVLLLCLALLGISNTILLAILERTKEIGMMRAMGMTDRQMIIVYMLEAGMLGLIGSLLGTALGCALNYPMVKYGWDMSQMADALGGGIGFRITTILRSMWDVPIIAFTWIGATILSALMAYFPTKRAVKMPITDSLRFE